MTQPVEPVGTAVLPARLLPLRLLLVEDDPGDAFLVQELLDQGEQRVDVTTVETVAAAQQALTDAYDCVLLDLGLPDSEGLPALRSVLAVAGGTAVLCLTGLADEYRGVAAVAEGAQDYLVKGHVDGDLLWRAIRYSIERRRFVSELQRLHATQVQIAETVRLESGLLPKPDLHDEALRVHTHYRSGRDGVLGGDFYDVVETADGVAYALIGDVSGHGPDEAALGVSLRISWRTLVLAGTDQDRLLPVLEQVLLRERQHDEIFATLCMVVVEPGRGSARLFLAGHPAPLQLGPRPMQVPDDLAGPPLGIAPGVVWGSRIVPLEPGWRLMLFTDGIVEGRNGEGADRLGVDGLLALATSHPSYDDSPALVADLVQRAQQAHGGALADDVAIVVLEHHP